DGHVTGVQTCALPIFLALRPRLHPVDVDLPVVAAVLLHPQVAEADALDRRLQPHRRPSRPAMPEDGRNAALDGMGAALDRDGKAGLGRLAAEVPRLPEVVQARQDDREIVAAAALDDEPVEADVFG